MRDLFPDRPSGGSERRNGRGINQTYDYRDEKGDLLFQVCRREPKGFFQRRPDGKGGWINNLKDVRRVLYGLSDLITAVEQSKTVFIVEGEKDADRLVSVGLVATTCPAGAGKWRPEYNESLRGARVVIVPDNDTAGRAHAEKVVSALSGIAAEVKVIELPGLPEKGDVSDWLDDGHTVDELKQLVEEAKPRKAKSRQSSPPKSGDKDPEARPAQRLRLVEIATNDAELFHTPTRAPYATYPVRDHYETAPIEAGRDTSSFRRWLVHEYETNYGGVPTKFALEDALETLAARAVHDGKVIELHIRIVALEGALYLDLANADWEVVRISADGWEIVTDAPVRFLRPPNMGPLPRPERGGSIRELKRLLNLESDDDWILIVAWLIGALGALRAFPILILHGAQGAAKSTTAKMVSALVDPVIDAPTRALPRHERDLAVASRNAYVLSFANISKVVEAISDALCRIATGEGFATRKLYTDDGEAIFGGARPIILNGIPVFWGDRNDLLDRAVLIQLPPISDHRRRDEATLWVEFDEARPRILGALLDAMVVGLDKMPTLKVRNLPRMADFAKWVRACETALPWRGGKFLKAYRANIESARTESLSTSLLASALRRFVAMDVVSDAPWEGTASELLARLRGFLASPSDLRSPEWPDGARALSSQLRSIAPALSSAGIEVTFRKSGKRVIAIRNMRAVRDAANTHSETGADEDCAPAATGRGEGILELRRSRGRKDAKDASSPLDRNSEREEGEGRKTAGKGK